MLSSKQYLLRMKTFIMIAVRISSTTVFLFCVLYGWMKGSKFGPQPECNHLVKFVLSGFNPRDLATGSCYSLWYCIPRLDDVAHLQRPFRGMHEKLQNVVDADSLKGRAVKPPSGPSLYFVKSLLTFVIQAGGILRYET
jgi:hypothetical protein